VGKGKVAEVKGSLFVRRGASLRRLGGRGEEGNFGALPVPWQTEKGETSAWERDHHRQV